MNGSQFISLLAVYFLPYFITLAFALFIYNLLYSLNKNIKPDPKIRWIMNAVISFPVVFVAGHGSSGAVAFGIGAFFPQYISIQINIVLIVWILFVGIGWMHISKIINIPFLRFDPEKKSRKQKMKGYIIAKKHISNPIHIEDYLSSHSASKEQLDSDISSGAIKAYVYKKHLYIEVGD